MRIVVWGAGAIGGSVGAYLIKSGLDVLLVERDPEHRAAISTRGLSVEGARGDLTVPATVVTPEAAPDALDVVLLAVKAQHTRDAAAEIAPRLAPDGVVVSLQNGLNHETIAEAVGAERVIPTFVNFAADLVAPGVIRFGGEAPIYIGELSGGRTERVERIAAALERFGPTIVTENIHGYLWSKLAMISILFGTSLVDADVADILDREPGRTLFGHAARETLTVAAALGIRPEPFAEFDPARFGVPAGGSGPAELAAGVAAVGDRFRGMLKTRSGYWRDLAVRRRRTEVDHQVGAVVRYGGKTGVPVPINRGILDLIHEIEAGQRAQSWANLDRLAEGVPAAGSGSSSVV